MSRIRWYASGGKRYYVIGVTGFRIDPASHTGSAGGNRPAGTSYAVLDRDWAHREMASFEVWSGMSTARSKKLAERTAAELNALEDTRHRE